MIAWEEALLYSSPEAPMMTDRVLFVTLLFSIPAAAAVAADPPEKASPEENILQKAGVAADGDGLLTFFHDRTPTDAERTTAARSWTVADAMRPLLSAGRHRLCDPVQFPAATNEGWSKHRLRHPAIEPIEAELGFAA